MKLRTRESGTMPMNIQFFAEGSGEGGEGNGNQNNNAGNGNSNQNTGNNNQGTTYTQEQLDGIVNNRIARAEQSALKVPFFQQQGMSENEVTQAINSYKEQRAKNKPDVAGMQTQLAQEQSRNLQLTIENSATLQAVGLGIDAKSIPYVIKMADFKDVAGEDGTVDAEKVKAAINKVLEDVPALKPAESGANNQGFQIGAPNNNNQQNQDDLLRGIFGIKKK